MTNLTYLELGDCQKGFPFAKLLNIKGLKHLRLEKGDVSRSIGALEMLEHFEEMELIDVELRPGFGEGFIRMRKLRKLLLIPAYREEVILTYIYV